MRSHAYASIYAVVFELKDSANSLELEVATVLNVLKSRTIRTDAVKFTYMWLAVLRRCID